MTKLLNIIGKIIHIYATTDDTIPLVFMKKIDNAI
jgi:hypothetical protein